MSELKHKIGEKFKVGGSTWGLTRTDLQEPHYYLSHLEGEGWGRFTEAQLDQLERIVPEPVVVAGSDCWRIFDDGLVQQFIDDPRVNPGVWRDHEWLTSLVRALLKHKGVE